MARTKYIVFENDGLPMPVIFPEIINHDGMARMIKCSIIGAGFVSIDTKNLRVNAYGKSVSLNIGPSAEDNQILTDLLFPS